MTSMKTYDVSVVVPELEVNKNYGLVATIQVVHAKYGLVVDQLVIDSAGGDLL